MKRDIKYILKRIIIGVGIALVLANINKCNVYAESITDSLCVGSSPTLSTCNYSDYSDAINFNYYYNNMQEGFPLIFSGNSNNIDTNSHYITYSLVNNDLYSNSSGTMLFVFTDFRYITDNWQWFNIGIYEYSHIYTNLSSFNGYYQTSISKIVPPFSASNPNTCGINNCNALTPNSDSYVLITTDENVINSINDSDNFYYNGSNYRNEYWFKHNDNFIYFLVWHGPFKYSIFEDAGLNMKLIPQIQTNQPNMNIDSLYLYDSNSSSPLENDETTIQDYWLLGFYSGGDTWLDNSYSDGGEASIKLKSLLEFLKLPFNWLKSLSKDNCTSLTIPFPYTNSNFEIPCLSSIFSNVLGNFFNIFVFLISALYVYRITLSNINCITEVLDPQDDKLEVIEL